MRKVVLTFIKTLKVSLNFKKFSATYLVFSWCFGELEMVGLISNLPEHPFQLIFAKMY
jgi:hypothetical protein